MAYDFKEQLKIGKIAEERVLNYLLAEGYEVESVADKEEYFSKGIDFIIHWPDGNVNIDVKVDFFTEKTGNIAVELFSLKPDGQMTKGWLYKKDIDYLYYVTAPSYRLYIIDMDKLREVVYEHNRGSYVLADNTTYKSMNLLFSINQISYALKSNLYI